MRYQADHLKVRNWLSIGVRQDAKHAARLFGRHRVAFATAIIGLGLALGLSTAIVAVLTAVLFPRLQVADPASLM